MNGVRLGGRAFIACKTAPTFSRSSFAGVAAGIAGFGSLGLANNPTLSGLGIACAIGLAWSLFATIFFTLPAAALAEPMSNEIRKHLAGT